MGIINRRVDPHRKMLRQHPYDVYRALEAMRLRSILADDDPNRYYDPNQIATVLYSNFHELHEDHQKRVIQLKLNCALTLLKDSCFVEEDTVTKHLKDRWNYSEVIRQGLGIYRARPNIFNMAGWDRKTQMDSTRHALDRTWGIVLGRPNAVRNYLR